MHTSTVTVAIIDPDIQTNTKYQKRTPNDFRIEWFSGTGAGGQNRNKCQNSCRAIHIPSGLSQTAQTRDRKSSQQQAMQALINHLDEMARNDKYTIISKDRKEQVGSGMRGDKIRTYRFQDDTVKDHITGRSSTTTNVLAGKFEILWN